MNKIPSAKKIITLSIAGFIVLLIIVSILYLFIDNQQSIEDTKTELEIVLGKTIYLNPISFDSIEKSLDIGYYLQAIEMLNNLKKLCNISKCKNCETVKCSSCSKFIQQ